MSLSAIAIARAADMEVEDEWFDNELSFDATTGQWLNEAYIINMVETFPVHNQEYVYNGVNHLGLVSYVPHKAILRNVINIV